MKPGFIIIALALTVGLIGCAVAQQAVEDYNVGKSTPLVAGEISAIDAAEALIAPIKPFIPAPLQPFAGFLAIALGSFGSWRRGRRIRKGKGTTANPISGPLGARIGLEGIVQTAASIFAGVMQVGASGSGWKRAWKTALVVITTGTIGALTMPAVGEFIVANPQVAVIFTGIASAVAAIEKKLQTVIPIQPTE